MKAQARALIEAAAGRTLNVMFPMVSEPWEFDEAHGAVRGAASHGPRAAKRAAARGSATARCSRCRRSPKCSTMLLPKLDFLSIGTNDLTQFLFAADRADPSLAERYDWLSPAILRFLKRVLDAGRRGRRAGRRVRRDGRPAARGDGADRHRHRALFDHAGRGRAGQGDGPLARRGGCSRSDGDVARPARQQHAEDADRLGQAPHGGMTRSGR